ncbi:MAG: hypothetical protein QW470_03930 [Candidatus Caldarchaeum sp.]
MRLSRQMKFIVESTLLAVLLTAVPVILLVLFYLNGLLTPLNLVVWLFAALGWTALITIIYVRKLSKRGGITLKQ